jgi:hypothetical protein
MTVYTVKFTDNYIIPKNINTATPAIWELTFNHLSHILDNKITDTLHINTSDELKKIEEKYQRLLTDAKEELRKQQEYNIEQQEQTELVRNKIAEEYVNQIKNLELKLSNKDLEYKTQYDNIKEVISYNYNLQIKTLENQLTNKDLSYTKLQEEFNQKLSISVMSITEQLEHKHKTNEQLVKQLYENKEYYLQQTIDNIKQQYDQKTQDLINQDKKYSEEINKIEQRFNKWFADQLAAYEAKYNAEKIHYENQITEHKLYINKLEDTWKQTQSLALEEQKARYNAELIEKDKYHNTIIEQLQFQITKLDDIIKEQRTQSKDSLLHTEIFNKLNNHSNTVQDSFKEIINVMQPLKKFYSGSNQEKGALGESIIYTFLSERYPESITNYTAHTSGDADIQFIKNKLKILIEIKNKAIITDSDLKKFLRDVHDNYDAGKINSAIFVSLRTNAIPGKDNQNMHIEHDGNIPIIYIHINPLYVDSIKYAIVFLDKILNIENQSNESIKALKSHLMKYYNCLTDMIKTMSEKATKLKLELNKTTKYVDKLKRELADIDQDYTTFCIGEHDSEPELNNTILHPEVKEDDTNDNDHSEEKVDTNTEEYKLMDQSIEDFYLKQLEHKTYPTVDNICKHCKLTKKQLRMYPSNDKYIERALDTLLFRYIKDENIKAYNELTIDYNKITRNTLVKSEPRCISDYSYNILNGIMKSANISNPLEYIKNHFKIRCEKYNEEKP